MTMLRLQLNHGAVTNEFLIKKQLEGQRVVEWKDQSRKPREIRLDSDRRLPFFSYTPDSFSLIIVPMISEK